MNDLSMAARAQMTTISRAWRGLYEAYRLEYAHATEDRDKMTTALFAIADPQPDEHRTAQQIATDCLIDYREHVEGRTGR